MGNADMACVPEPNPGEREGADEFRESPILDGPSLYPLDLVTQELRHLGSQFVAIQKTRKSFWQREYARVLNNGGDDALARASASKDQNVIALKKIEDRLSRQLKSTLRKHVLWPWLEDKSGVSGPLTARLIGLIADPHRFPGQRCSEGHYLRPIYVRGEKCPRLTEERDESKGVDGDEGIAGIGEAAREYESENRPGLPCPGIILPPRPGTGTRSLWHWAGLHVVNGRSPRKTKGIQADWNPKVRTLLIGPDGLADQIVKHRTPGGLREIYDSTKQRLTESRGPEGAEVDRESAVKVAVKRFVGDLLQEWKRSVPLEPPQ